MLIYFHKDQTNPCIVYAIECLPPPTSVEVEVGLWEALIWFPVCIYIIHSVSLMPYVAKLAQPFEQSASQSLGKWVKKMFFLANSANFQIKLII